MCAIHGCTSQLKYAFVHDNDDDDADNLQDVAPMSAERCPWTCRVPKDAMTSHACQLVFGAGAHGQSVLSAPCLVTAPVLSDERA